MDDDDDDKRMSTSFSAIHVQKMKLEKLMQNIDKEVEIPERVQERKFPEPPDFIRNIMGSSAGAGSGEFHVYRHLRRKEFARQRFIEEQAKKEELDVKYRQKLEENMKIAEEKTAKKRAKRLKKKARKKIREKNGAAVGTKKSVDETSEEEDESDSEKPKEESEEHKAVSIKNENDNENEQTESNENKVNENKSSHSENEKEIENKNE